MKRFSLLLVAAAIGLQPLAADAQVFNGTPFDVEFLQFLGGSGVNGTYGVQVGPYEGRFLGDGETAVTNAGVQDQVDRSVSTLPFALYCVDFEHYATNSNGLVNVSMVGGDLSNTRLGSFASYQRTAYLSSLFDSWTEHQTALASGLGGTWSQSTVWSGLHAAIWNTSGSNPTLDYSTDVARDYFSSLADERAGDFDTSGWYVLSEADVPLSYGNSGQEFLIRTGRTTSVPEPSTILLMATGLLLLLGASRRRTIELGSL